MKTHIFRTLLLLFLSCALIVTMTGCEKLDYRKAIGLYNTGNYEAAADIFSALGDYENASELYTDCQYWIAAKLAEQGDFESALPRFVQLGDYRNSPQWVTECKYQIAVEAFTAERWEDARDAFSETPDFKNTPEYLRKLDWLSLFDAIANVSFNFGSGYSLKNQIDGKEYCITADEYANELEFYVCSFTTDPFHFSDDLQIILTRDSTVAQYRACSSFAMDYLDDQIYSSQTATGRIDITTCTPETKLVIETYEMFGVDNRGEYSESTDPSDSLMDDAMAENLYELLTVIPELLLDAGITVTLQDIGFSAL